MRLWSLHPSLLDRQGLTALWREALLAQAVLAGRTRGYRRHPQLERFQALPDPLGAITRYLDAIADDADRRGYAYKRSRIDQAPRWQGLLATCTSMRALPARSCVRGRCICAVSATAFCAHAGAIHMAAHAASGMKHALNKGLPYNKTERRL